MLAQVIWQRLYMITRLTLYSEKKKKKQLKDFELSYFLHVHLGKIFTCVYRGTPLPSNFIRSGTPEWNSGCKIIVTYTYYCIMSPTNEGEEGHIAFGEDPVDVRVASYLRSYHLNQWVDFHQTVIDTLLGRGKEEIRFW